METDDADNSEVSDVINSSDITEDLPDNNEDAFVPTSGTGLASGDLPNILVATSQGLFSTEQQLLQVQSGIKTTHILIHDQSTIDALKNQAAQQVLVNKTVPESGITLIAKTRKTRYNWDASVNDPVLPVRCRSISGCLDKQRLGSGGRGRCIKVKNNWYTPSEFEALCGRASSKDWKRSIRYAGRTLQCLIEEDFLQPHATSCTCAACCDDETVGGPVRLFTPYKRRKKDCHLKTEPLDDDKSDNDLTSKDAMVVSVSPNSLPSAQDSIQITTASNLMDSLGVSHASFITSSDGESVIVTPVSSSSQSSRNVTSGLDFNEQRQWWQLEEMVKNLTRQVQEVQKQVEAVKAQSTDSRESSLQQMKLQMENEKKEALNTSRIEAQMNLSRAILEARAEKEIAVQQALQQARAEMQTKLGGDMLVANGEATEKRCANCNREAFCECTGCHNVSYCSVFCHRKDWPNHRNECCSDILDEADIVSDDKNEDC